MENKTCSKCQCSKPVESFGIRDKKTGGINSWCNPCLKSYKSARWQSKKDEMRDYKKKWYELNKEDQKEKCRQRYQSGDKKKHSKVVWRNKILRDYKLTEEQYFVMLEDQQDVCKICGKNYQKRLSVDHCHTTGVVRGLLCHKCNAAIGLLNDDPELLKKSAAYIESAMTDAVAQ